MLFWILCSFSVQNEHKHLRIQYQSTWKLRSSLKNEYMVFFRVEVLTWKYPSKFETLGKEIWKTWRWCGWVGGRKKCILLTHYDDAELTAIPDGHWRAYSNIHGTMSSLCPGIIWEGRTALKWLLPALVPAFPTLQRPSVNEQWICAQTRAPGSSRQRWGWAAANPVVTSKRDNGQSHHSHDQHHTGMQTVFMTEFCTEVMTKAPKAKVLLEIMRFP